MACLRFVLLTLCVLAQGAAAQADRNPFKPAPVTVVVAPKPPGIVAATPGLPDSRPGPYRVGVADMIPPPPPGLPPLLLPPGAGAGFQELPAGAIKPAAKTEPAVKEERKSDVFLTRDELRLQRAKCAVSLKSAAEVRVGAEGGRQVVRLTIVGGRQCIKAVATSQDWFSVSAMSDSGEMTLVVDENEETEERAGEVNIANTGTALTVTVRQGRSTQGFRKLKL